MESALTSPLHFRASILAAFLLITLPGPVYAQWVASDSTFNNANWTSTVIPNISTTTAQCRIMNSSGVTTCLCGQNPAGNPTQSRKTCHSYSWPPYPAAIWVAHLYQPSFYNPSTQGAITGLSYSYDLSPPTESVTYSLLVFQNFTYYQTTLAPVDNPKNTNPNPPLWKPVSRANLTAANFVKIYGPPSTPNTPDFSCRGSAIQFGYITGNSNTNSTVSLIDNWTVNITRGNTCPCP